MFRFPLFSIVVDFNGLKLKIRFAKIGGVRERKLSKTFVFPASRCRPLSLHSDLSPIRICRSPSIRCLRDAELGHSKRYGRNLFGSDTRGTVATYHLHKRCPCLSNEAARHVRRSVLSDYGRCRPKVACPRFHPFARFYEWVTTLIRSSRCSVLVFRGMCRLGDRHIYDLYV